MLQQSNSILRLCIVVVVVMLVQLSPVLSQDVKIGTQVWTSKNLDVSTFRNGEAIPEAKSKEEWVKARENKLPAWCYYDYDSKNGKVYGKLYNWFAVGDSRGLAPRGYHIPSDEEWTVLADFLGGWKIASPKLKSKTGWLDSKFGMNNAGQRVKTKTIWPIPVLGNNSSGFYGLPGGDVDHYGRHWNITFQGKWWSSSQCIQFYDNKPHPLVGFYYIRVMTNNAPEFQQFGATVGNGFSVRCLKD